MPSSPDITELWGNFKNLVKKITYDKTEVDDKLSDKSDINHTHELGGTNLISGTQDISFENTGVGEEDGEYRGLKVLHTNNTSDKYLDIIKLIYDKNKEYGEYYTLSFWVKGTPKENGVNSYFYSGGVTAQVVKSVDGWTKPYGDGECRFNITSEWRRVWVVYQLETNGTLDTPKSIAIRANAGADVYVAGLKFERGDQPSDWSPAPSDLAEYSHVHSRLVPTSIPANADLNDYTTQGSFYCPMNDTVRTFKNCPVTEALHLECYRHAGVRQVLQTFSPTSVRTFERNYYAAEGGHWSEWYEIANKEDITGAVGDIQSALDKIIGV